MLAQPTGVCVHAGWVCARREVEQRRQVSPKQVAQRLLFPAGSHTESPTATVHLFIYFWTLENSSNLHILQRCSGRTRHEFASVLRVTEDTVTRTDELYSSAESAPACAQLPVTVRENDASAEHAVSVCVSPLDLW